MTPKELVVDSVEKIIEELRDRGNRAAGVGSLTADYVAATFHDVANRLQALAGDGDGERYRFLCERTKLHSETRKWSELVEIVDNRETHEMMIETFWHYTLHDDNADLSGTCIPPALPPTLDAAIDTAMQAATNKEKE